MERWRNPGPPSRIMLALRAGYNLTAGERDLGAGVQKSGVLASGIGNRLRTTRASLLGGAAIWPLAARAQKPRVPVLGLLVSDSAASFADSLASVRQGLRGPGLCGRRLGP